MTETTKPPNGHLMEQMPPLPKGSEVTGDVDINPGHEEAARQAAERVGVERGALDRLEKGYTDQGVSSDEARKAVDETVADMIGIVSGKEKPEALFTGVVEVGMPGKQSKTAESVNRVCIKGPELCETALEEAELGGVDVGEVTGELDAAENNRRDGLDRVDARELAEETREEWNVRLKHLQDVAKMCVWDDERNRPAIDPAVLESRKERATWQASQEAALLVRDPEKCEDQEIIEAIAGSLVDNTDKLKQIAQQIADLKERLTFASADGQKQKLERAIVAAEKRQRVLTETNGTTDTVLAQNQVARILEQRAHADIEDEALRSLEELEKAISERINADKYPWTMPGAETVAPDKMEKMQAYYETLVRHQFPETDSKHEVRIAGLSYMPDDKAFLERNGVKPVEGYYNVFSREYLRRAGVFFVNTVGEGEQPIFGEVVADREGRFDPREKTFLTKEEFERVYNFQQRAGYGIGDLDPDDVVMDMIAADQVRNTREHNLVSVERIDKNGTTSSLFVDNDGGGLPGSFGGFFEIGGKRYRLTAVQANLINGHGDYPGVSEMYHPSFVIWDQRYMTASQYVKDVYSPPPTPQEVFYSIKSGTSTKRERDWLGVPLFILDK